MAYGNTQISVGASAGVVPLAAEKPAEKIAEAADQAMYCALEGAETWPLDVTRYRESYAGC